LSICFLVAAAGHQAVSVYVQAAAPAHPAVVAAAAVVTFDPMSSHPTDPPELTAQLTTTNDRPRIYVT